MRKFMVAMLLGLFIIGLAGISSAGMADDLLKKSDEATKKVNEANKEAHQGKEMLNTGQGKAIEAQGTATTETGGMTQELKEEAKKKTNETIDNLGK